VLTRQVGRRRPVDPLRTQNIDVKFIRIWHDLLIRCCTGMRLFGARADGGRRGYPRISL